jgi:hypothetical protein
VPEDEGKPAGRLLPWEPLKEQSEPSGPGKTDDKADRSDSET